MGKWVRVKDDSGIEKVSIVVRRDTDPEVYEWLQGIPYGKANAYIKAALRAYLKGDGVPSCPPPTAHPAPDRCPSSIHAEAKQAHGSRIESAPEIDPPASADDFLGGVDSENLALMREMATRF